MNNIILSIIVPSFNSSKYISKYINYYYDPSLVGKLEVLFIDDGSTDDTYTKLKIICTQFPSFFKCFHKINGGHGSAINFGVRIAKGKYFKVIDADDYPNKKELKKLIIKLKKDKADYIITDYLVKDSSSGKKIIHKTIKSKEIVDSKFFSLLFNSELCFHSVIIKKSIWIQNNIQMSEHVYYEDQEYYLFPLKYSRSFSYYPLLVYVYCLGSTEQSVSMGSYKKHLKDLDKVFFCLINNYDFNYSVPSEKEKIMRKKIAEFTKGLYDILIRTVKDEKEVKKEIIRYDKVIKNHKLINYEFKERFYKFFRLFNYSFGLFLIHKKKCYFAYRKND